MVYLVRGANSWGEYVFERSADNWPDVKIFIQEAMDGEGNKIHPDDIEIFECSPLKFKITHTIEVSPK